MQKKYVTLFMADGFEMRCVYMMTDENITANADKKILFWYNETEYVHD